MGNSCGCLHVRRPLYESWGERAMLDGPFLARCRIRGTMTLVVSFSVSLYPRSSQLSNRAQLAAPRDSSFNFGPPCRSW
jgi:hypothetical protein